MPNTIVSLLIFILAILPGIPGDRIFTRFSGSDWRLKDWEVIARILIFSVLGLVVYSALTNVLSVPEPVYIFPSTFSQESLENINLSTLSVAYLGHWLASGTLGLLLGLAVQFVGSRTPSTIYPSSWDVFLRNHVPSHWVVVSLTNDEVYAGVFSSADLSVGAAERDVILEEPAIYVSEEDNYKSLQYQSLFIPASLVSSIAVIYEPSLDQRITEVGAYLFKGKEHGKDQKSA